MRQQKSFKEEPKAQQGTSLVSYIEGFQRPSKEQVELAQGSYPWGHQLQRILRNYSLLYESILNENILMKFHNFHQCDQKYLFSNNQNGNSVWKKLPLPHDDISWLAQVNEEGQTFEEYVDLMTLRSGEFSSRAAVGMNYLCICPIIKESDGGKWPKNAPDLKFLCQWASAYFNRTAVILNPVTIRLSSDHIPENNSDERKNKRRKIERALFCTQTYQRYLKHRTSDDGIRFQFHTDDLLRELISIREDYIHTFNISYICNDSFVRDVDYDSTLSHFGTYLPSMMKDFIQLRGASAVIGVTMEDIYSCDTDTFVAGMAAGASRVAVLSFARYHPHMKMNFRDWDDYGYAAKGSTYSYFAINKKRPNTSPERPHKMSRRYESEFLLRAGKLLVHEICHIYGISHCIYHSCIMNGTAHLVEDLDVPAHLCGVCLRKLNFRLGFNVTDRYRKLLNIYKTGRMTTEEKWIRRRLNSLEDQSHLICDENDGDNPSNEYWSSTVSSYSTSDDKII